jgi:hypothetical protein
VFDDRPTREASRFALLAEPEYRDLPMIVRYMIARDIAARTESENDER